MKKLFGNLTQILSKKKANIHIKVKHGIHETILSCQEGQNLMDVTNKIVNQDVNIYGLCDKQLACTTCSIQIESHSNKLKQPSQEELDIITTIPGSNQNTRMACQIYLTEGMDNMEIRISNKKQEI